MLRCFRRLIIELIINNSNVNSKRNNNYIIGQFENILLLDCER